MKNANNLVVDKNSLSRLKIQKCNTCGIIDYPVFKKSEMYYIITYLSKTLSMKSSALLKKNF